MSSMILLHIRQHAATSINSNEGKFQIWKKNKTKQNNSKSDLESDRGSVSTGQYGAATMSDGTNAVVMKLL